MVYALRTENGPIGVWITTYRRPTGSWMPTMVLVGDTLPFFFPD
jgi:hypothetical protein